MNKVGDFLTLEFPTRGALMLERVTLRSIEVCEIDDGWGEVEVTARLLLLLLLLLSLSPLPLPLLL